MKTLILPAALLVLLSSCQPSGRKAAEHETFTQTARSSGAEKVMVLQTSKADEPRAVKQSDEGERFLPKSKSLARFLGHFPTASMPLALNSKSHQQIDDKNYIAYEYAKYIPEIEEAQFSREVGQEFYYMARVGEGKRYAAVIYAVKNVIAGDNAPWGYVLASYNPEGKQIDKLVLGGQLWLADALRVGQINAEGEIAIKEYRQHWQKDPEEAGYYENKVVRTSYLKTMRYQIDNRGHFRQQTPMVALR